MCFGRGRLCTAVRCDGVTGRGGRAPRGHVRVRAGARVDGWISMDFGTTVALGAIAGLTIYLGLPFARLKNAPRALQAFLNALATGILIFLLWDVITKGTEPIDAALDAAREGQPTTFFVLLALFVVGL